jgi:hypothetical protein
LLRRNTALSVSIKIREIGWRTGDAALQTDTDFKFSVGKQRSSAPP